MRHPVLALLLAALSASATLMAEAAGPRRPVAPASDETPPQLTYLNLPKSVSVGPFGASLVYDIRAQDDVAGLWQVWPTLVGPSGQTIELSTAPYWGDLSIDKQVGWYLMPSVEPGQWAIRSVQACDAFGNCAVLDAAALASVGGRHRITVKNPGYDAVAPTLTTGQLSAYYRQGRLPPYLIARLTIQDTGTNSVSGVNGAEVVLCLADGFTCVSASGGTLVPGLASTTVVAASQVSEYMPQGQYWIKSIRVSDQQSNQRTYASTLFGGETDFAQLFPQPWLNLP